jgi:hypothetical protein
MARAAVTKRQPARPHRHSWHAIAIGAAGRIVEGCGVDRCTLTRVAAARLVGFWDDVDTARDLLPESLPEDARAGPG